MKILITGGSGTLGQYLNIELSSNSKDNEILTLHHNNVGNTVNFPNQKIDLTDFKRLKELLKTFKPDVILHTAGYANPEVCRHADKNEVLKNNVEVTEVIAKISSEINCKIIYTSTDLVYKNSSELKTESSPLDPLSLYAESKLMAEEKIRASCQNYIILRTALLYGIALNHTTNHFTQMISSLKENKTVTLFTDQFRTPLSLQNAAQLISKIISSGISNETLNFGGNEKLNRYDLGIKAAKIAGLDQALIKEIRFRDIKDQIKFSQESPLDVSMDNSKLGNYNVIPNPIDKALSEIFNI